MWHGGRRGYRCGLLAGSSCSVAESGLLRLLLLGAWLGVGVACVGTEGVSVQREKDKTPA